MQLVVPWVHPNLQRVHISILPTQRSCNRTPVRHLPIVSTYLLKYMVIAEWQRYRYVANEGTLHLDHIYLGIMRSVIKKLWKL